MERFKTKVVVITGAGSGLGRGLVLEFARLGWKIAVCDVEGGRAEESARRADEAGGEGFAVHCDVTRPEEVEDLAERVLARWGGAEIVVNNAGVPVVGYFEKIALEDWRYALDQLLMSVIYGCRVFVPIFKKQGRGHIVNTASAAGITPLPEMSPYNAAKAGVIALSETLRNEVKGSGIGVTVLCPSFFKTNLLERMRYTDERQLRMAEAFFEKFSFGTVESVSRSALDAIRKNRLYALPQPDIKILSFLKRMAPATSSRLAGFLYTRGLIDRILGI